MLQSSSRPTSFGTKKERDSHRGEEQNRKMEGVHR